MHIRSSMPLLRLRPESRTLLITTSTTKAADHAQSLQAAVQRIHSYVSNMEDKINQLEKKK